MRALISVIIFLDQERNELNN